MANKQEDNLFKKSTLHVFRYAFLMLHCFREFSLSNREKSVIYTTLSQTTKALNKPVLNSITCVMKANGSMVQKLP